MLRIKLVKSLIGNNKRNRSIVAALGLKKMHHSVDHKDTPQIRGMIHRVKHMLEVTSITDAEAKPRTTGTPQRARTTSMPTEKVVRVAKPKPAPKPAAKPTAKAAPKAAKPAAEKAPKAAAPKAAAKPVKDATTEAKPKATKKAEKPNEEKRKTK